MTFQDLRTLLLAPCCAPMPFERGLVQVQDVELAPSVLVDDSEQVWYVASYTEDVPDVYLAA